MLENKPGAVWDGPNREDAQGREETFWVVLASKSSLDSPGALQVRNSASSWVRKHLSGGTHIVDHDWLVREDIFILGRHLVPVIARSQGKLRMRDMEARRNAERR